MKRDTNPTRDYFKLVLFVLFLLELVLFFIAIICGRILGYDCSFVICFWLGIIVAGSISLIVLMNLMTLLYHKLIRKMVK